MLDKVFEALVITTVVILSLYVTFVALEFIIKLIWKFIKQ